MKFENWKKHKLGDVVSLNAKSLNPSQYSEILFDYFSLPAFDFNKQSELVLGNAIMSNKYLVPDNSILFSKLNPRIPRVWKINSHKSVHKKICSTEFLPLQVNEKLSTLDFIFYVLQTNSLLAEIKGKATGTSGSHQRIRPDDLLETEIFLPSLELQKKISAILSTLDDKIELNKQINKTQDKISKTIFKEWFVDFNFPTGTGKMKETEIGKIPVGWKVETFENVFDADRGLSYKGAGLTQSYATPMHNLNSVLEGGGYKTIGIKYYNGDYKDKHIVNAGELIIANTEQGHKYLLIGFPAIVPNFYGDTGIFSHHIYRMRAKKNCYLTADFMYHLLLQQQVREQVIGFANGTTVNMLKIEGLQKPKFAMPPKELADKFSAIAKTNRLQAEQNIEENKTLSSLRDFLLPKLMKGEVRIKN
ncbi:MAG: restriction endonuclease subunit S [Bacteroidetes bacterium]|nr:restriction endonuclease subunit S [Bacteroidota bacterium]